MAPSFNSELSRNFWAPVPRLQRFWRCHFLGWPGKPGTAGQWLWRCQVAVESQALKHVPATVRRAKAAALIEEVSCHPGPSRIDDFYAGSCPFCGASGSHRAASNCRRPSASTNHRNGIFGGLITWQTILRACATKTATWLTDPRGRTSGWSRADACNLSTYRTGYKKLSHCVSP